MEDVSLNLNRRLPVCDQLVDQLTLSVATGDLLPGRRLPTVRRLACQLALNPSTVAKAYRELERTGIIVTRRGGGSFVADQFEERSLPDARDDRLNVILSRAALEALGLGYEPNDVEARFVAHVARWRERRLRRHAPEERSVHLDDLCFTGSHDLAVELLLSRMRGHGSGFTINAKYAGSLGGLIAVERGEANIAGTHLLDEESGQYNLPFVRRLLTGEEVLIMTLVERWQGLLVPRRNPKGIKSFEDIARPDVVFVNRQKGSGTRVLLDHWLRRLHIAHSQLIGYDREEVTHLGVAAAIAEGSADVGLGIESAARPSALDFVPLVKERYDLVMLRAAADAPWFPALESVLADESFRRVVAAMGGYDLSRCGQIVS